VKWGAPILNAGPGTTAPPLASALHRTKPAKESYGQLPLPENFKNIVKVPASFLVIRYNKLQSFWCPPPLECSHHHFPRDTLGKLPCYWKSCRFTVKNVPHKTGGCKCTTLKVEEVSDLCKILTPKDKDLSGSFISKEINLTFNHHQPGEAPGLYTPSWPCFQNLDMQFLFLLLAPTHKNLEKTTVTILKQNQSLGAPKSYRPISTISTRVSSPSLTRCSQWCKPASKQSLK